MLPPYLRDIPLEFHTDRLTLRAMRAGDGAALHEMIVETIDDLRAFLALHPWFANEVTVDDIEAHTRLAEALRIQRTMFRWMLCLKGSGSVVGWLDHHEFDWNIPSCEIGLTVRTKQMGKGYAVEALRASIDFALEHLQVNRCYGLTDSLHTAAIKMNESVGPHWKLEGTLRNSRVTPDGELRDILVYAAATKGRA